jgi:hypothetical protein
MVSAMAQETPISKKRRGPPPTGQGKPVLVRFHEDMLGALDAWRSSQSGQPSRPEAVRQMLAEALRERGYLGEGGRAKGLRPSELTSENDG